MKKLTIETLVQSINAKTYGNTDGVITGVSVDSRTIKKGDCFFAVTGPNFDGHDYIDDAFKKGAVCAVVEKNIKKNNLLRVPCSVEALGDLARYWRGEANFKVVAITGSVGKTTTRQIAHHVLSQHFRVFSSPKNFNNYIGLPLTLLSAKPKDQIVIAELGSNRPGEVSYLSKIAQPDIALITNVYPAHLEGFGNLKTIVEEKLSIAAGLSPGDTLLINADFKQLTDSCKKKKLDFTTFGKSKDTKIVTKGSCCSFAIENTKISLPLPGQSNAENALAAWAICRLFGITIADFAEAIKTLPPIPMRTEFLQAGKLKIINDCYNANPVSMESALKILANLKTNKKTRKVFICADMTELGLQSKKLHTQLAAHIIKAEVQLLITVGKLAQITAQAVKSNAKFDLQVKSFKDTVSACNNLQELIKDSDIVLVKGSRANKLEMTVAKLKELFAG